MLFFEKHFNKEHFFHSPHKWFLAFLISPIHFLERRYQTRYHLNYEHAKKLFVFDLSLVALIILLIVATLSWFFYNPGVADKIQLTVRPSIDRIRSGDYLTYNISYKNKSEKNLINTNLVIDIPETFILDKVDPQILYSSSTRTFNLGKFNRGASGEINISGWFYGIPETETRLLARLSYQQENRNVEEEKISPLITTLRGSVLQTKLTAADKILSPGSTLISLNLKNTGTQTLNKITLPLSFENNELTISPDKVDLGTTQNNAWQIDKLEPGQEINLNGRLFSNLKNNQETIELKLTPSIELSGLVIPQTSLVHNFKIIKTEIALTANWTANQEKIKPGEQTALNLYLTNKSNTTLSNLTIMLPIPQGVIDLNRLTHLNNGIYKDGYLILNKTFQANLETLKPEQTTNLEIKVPVNENPTGGNNITLTLTPRIRAEVTEVADSFYENTVASPPLKLGSALNLYTELRYYTNEGDQLGRGPLPPQVEKETKYWLIVKITNTSNQLSQVNFQAELPDYVKWTGKTSANFGKQPTFDPLTKKISWNAFSFTPYEKAGIYMELSLTPTADQLNTNPVMAQKFSVSAHDDFIGENLFITSGNLDTSLSQDPLGKAKGTTVR